MENYRKKFVEYTHLTIPNGWVVHHVDGNRENNSVGNLVLVTKSEHALLHNGCALINGVIHKKCNVCGQWRSYHFYLNRNNELLKSCYDCRQQKKIVKTAKKQGYYDEAFKELVDYTPGIFMGKVEYKGKVLKKLSTNDKINVDNLVIDEEMLLKL